MKISREFAVGLFFIFGLVILVLFTVQLRNWDWLSGRQTYYVLFNKVNRLDIGAPVLVQGVQMGQVNKLEYVSRGNFHVLVTVRLQNDVDLYSNATVTVSTAPVIGETTIDINAGGPASETVHALAPGSTIEGTAKPEIEEQVGEVRDRLVETLSGASAYVNDPKIQADVKRLLANLADASEKMNQTLTQFNDDLQPLVTDIRKSWPAITRFIANANRLTTQTLVTVKQTGDSIQQAADAGRVTATEIGNLSQQLKTTAERLDRLVGENQGSLSETIKETNQAVAELRKTLAQLNTGRGTLGRMFYDPSLFDEIKDLVSSISQTLTGRRESILPQGSFNQPAPAKRQPAGASTP